MLFIKASSVEFLVEGNFAILDCGFLVRTTQSARVSTHILWSVVDTVIVHMWKEQGDEGASKTKSTYFTMLSRTNLWTGISWAKYFSVILIKYILSILIFQALNFLRK